MDTTAYLHSQGWLGTGHALAARGLSKPLLVSQKQNVLGVGKKRHDAHADQWWARAFDGCLKGLEVSRVGDAREKGTGGKKGDGGETGGGKKERDGGQKGNADVGVRVEGRGGGLDALRSGSAGRGGLYGFFVRGEGLRGTFVEETGREGVVVEEEIVAVNGEGAVQVEKGVDGKRREEQEGQETAERRRRRKERKERKEPEVAVFVVVGGEEVPDKELSKRLRKEERRKGRRGRDGAQNAAEDGAVMATVIAETSQGELDSSLQKKKRRRVEASDGGSYPELITSEDRVTTETLVSGNCEPKAMQGKEESLVEKLERRQRKAARKALKTEQNPSGDGQAGQEADGTNKTHRKKKSKHTEK